MERTKLLKKLLPWLTLSIVIVSSFTHLYRIGHTFIFQNDEGRDALITYRMIDQRKPVLLGPETSVGNMYLGPFYYYLLVPSLIVSGLNPVGPAIFVALLGVVTTYLLIRVSCKEFGNKVGLVAGLIFAVSPIMVQYTRNSWNPNVIPFFALILYVLHKKEKWWTDLLSGAIIGILFQLHYVALVLPVLLVCARLWKYIKEKSVKAICIYAGLLVIGFLCTTFPFWVFEMRHQWVNTQAFFSYLQDKSMNNAGGLSPSYGERLVKNVLMLINDIVGSEPVSSTSLNPIIAASAALCLLSVIFVKKSRFVGYILIGTIVIVSVLKENILDHYVTFLFPFVCMALGVSLFSRNMIKYIAIVVLAVLLYRAIPSLTYNIGKLESSESKRAELVANYIEHEADGRPYNVVNSQGSYTTTIQYYLAKGHNRPKNDLQDLIFDICSGPCPADDETTVLLFLTGPAHPALADYLGHPQLNEFSGQRHFVKNEWVAYDIWVATIVLDH